MTAAPRIPKEDRSFADCAAADVDAGSTTTDRDSNASGQSSQPDEVERVQQDRFGRLGRNPIIRWQVSDR